LDQALAASGFEVIVVNDSGYPLPEAEWQQSTQVQVIHTQQSERCVARNTGAAIAKGSYLHFLDDDDWLLPGALEHFEQLAKRVGDTAWLYGGAQLVDRSGQPIIQLHVGMQGNCFAQVMAGEWIPLQASLIRTDAFFAVGGFNPATPGIEDIDLARRIALRGNVASIPEAVASLGMGIERSSTDYARAAKLGRWARESILSEPGVYARMRASACSGYWRGRMVRAYLTSAIWNLQARRGFTAASRGMFSLLSLAMAGRSILSPSFWRAVARPHESGAFLAGFREAGRPVERREIHSLQEA
jgi:glycosyltransferase involved in cell wall biosynthesis